MWIIVTNDDGTKSRIDFDKVITYAKSRQGKPYNTTLSTLGDEFFRVMEAVEGFDRLAKPVDVATYKSGRLARPTNEATTKADVDEMLDRR